MKCQQCGEVELKEEERIMCSSCDEKCRVWEKERRRERLEKLLEAEDYYEQDLVDFMDCLFESLEILFDMGIRSSCETNPTTGYDIALIGRSILSHITTSFHEEYDFIRDTIGSVYTRKAHHNNELGVLPETRLGIQLDKKGAKKEYIPGPIKLRRDQ